MKHREKKNLSLYQKFTLTIVVTGLVPMLVLSTFIANKMIYDYREAMRTQYEQAAGYVAGSLEAMLDSYNTISKMPYHYNFAMDDAAYRNYLSFDNFRKIVYGVDYSAETMEQEREADMKNFLQNVENADSGINGTHFIAVDLAGNSIEFHHSSFSTYFKDKELFAQTVAYEKLDRGSNKLLLIPTHGTGYFSGLTDPVFTVGRNYFDLRGEVGNTPYVGTIFLDINLKKVEKLFRSVKFSGHEEFYVINDRGDCFYSSIKDKIGVNVAEELGGLADTEKQLVLTSPQNAYGLHVIVVMDTAEAFGNIKRMQQMMYIVLGISVLTLLCGSVYFSRRLTKPIHEMMGQMEQVENGNFDRELPVRSNDEIGILSKRFNQMGTALKTRVPVMIEALAEQIHYLIGPMQDMVPLEKEIDIIRKYVYLLNCRISGKVHLMVEVPGVSKCMVPKLILQPIVENAFVHGIKPRSGSGSVMIEAAAEQGFLEISVMDNGMGMDEEALAKIHSLLAGNEPGIKNEYNWQSIGLKNVHDRIRFLYGEEYGIRITSTPNIGTMVRLLIPYTKGDKTDA